MMWILGIGDWGLVIRNTQHATRNTQHVIRSLPIWTLLLIVLLASAQLWGPGMVSTRGGGDSPFLLQRLHQMTANLRAGVFPVRWMPDAAYGLGYPFFNHYSALPFYLAAVFNLSGLDALTALKLTQTLGFLIAALAMYGWVNHLCKNQIVAWLAAVAYTVAPFHLVNVYVRGDSLSEFYAFVFYPLILWSLERVVRADLRCCRSAYGNIASLALAYAGLILSHNISAFIFSPFVLLYLLLLALRVAREREKSAWRGIVEPLTAGLSGLALGLALSAWAWLPALLELDYVQAQNLTGDYFFYAEHFRAANLIQPRLTFDYSIQVTTGGPSPFAMGGLQALVAVAGLSLLLRFALAAGLGFRRLSFAFLVTGLLVSTAMITPLSRPLWDHVPLLEKVQFPWRFLSVQSLFAAVAAAALVLRLKGRRAWIVAGAIALALAASTLLLLRPERLLIGPDDVTTTRLQEYELFTGNIGTTVRYEWLPRAAAPRPFTFDTVIEPEAPARAIPLAGELVEATQTQRRPTERVWRVRAGNAGATLAFPLLYWPGWQAWVDGESTSVEAAENAGYLELEVPPGQHTVRLKLGRTPVRAAAETLSLAASLILLVLIAWQIQALRFTSHVLRNTPLGHATLFLIGLLFLAAQSSPPPNRPDDLTMDFVARPYLHHNPKGVVFGDQVRLLSYTFSADRLAPGEMLTVTLTWDGGQQLRPEAQPEVAAAGGRVSLRLVSPAEHLPDLKSGPLALAQSSAPLEATTVHRLVLPENTPRGLYLVQVQLEEAEREAVYLRPVRVISGAPVPPDAPVLALAGPDIRLHAAELAPGPESNQLTVDLEWSTVRRLAANYAISLRLLDPDGVQRAQPPDTQPGYGFAPTSLWRPGEQVADRYTLPLPNDLSPGDGYRLTFVFYRHSSQVARVALGPFALPLASRHVFEPPARLFELPPLSHPLNVDYVNPADSTGSDQIRLAGYALQPRAETLDLTLWWVAQRQPQTDYTVFVHLFDLQTEAIPVQHDAMPRQGTYPTSGWLAGEVVSDTISLSLDDVPPGEYRLAVGLYEVTTGDRLPVTAPDGTPLPDGRLVLPDEIKVSGE
jgi:hypothetical protein